MVKDTSDETFKKIEKKTKNTSLLERIKHVQEIRKAIKEKDNLEKLVSTGSFNPDFKVIGAKNGRMSGGSEVGVRGGSFNPQGVQRERSFRTFFSLHRRGETLSGGDFKAFEVTILHGACQDEQLATDLKQGKAFHTTFGTFLYELSHEDIESTKGTSDDLYYKSKTGALATIYGAEPYRVGYSTDTSTERAKDAIDELHARYPRYRDFCEFIESRFQGMYQPGGLGTPVIWREPEDAVRSLLGFARYFTLENSVSRSLFELASHLPLKGFTETVTRKNRIQSAQGATQTALFAAAFNIRGQVVRAARNHVISSTGAYITKEVQNAIWSLQPVGVHEWYVKPFNVHDEVLVTHKPELANRIKEIVDTTVEKFREVVPLIAIDWKTNMESWADK